MNGRKAWSAIAVASVAATAWTQRPPQPETQRAIEIPLRAPAGVACAIESAADLDAPAWTEESALVGTGGPQSGFVSLRDAGPRRFFRLRHPAASPSPIVHRDAPSTNTLMFEDFNDPGTRSFLQWLQGMSYASNTGGLASFPYDGATHDPKVVFTQLYGSIDFLSFGWIRVRHRYSGTNSTATAWANPAKTGEQATFPVRTNLQTFTGNRAFPVAGDGSGVRIDPVPTTNVPAGVWGVDYIALDRGRTVGWEFDETGSARGGVNAPVFGYGFAGVADGAAIEGTNGFAVTNGLFAAPAPAGGATMEFGIAASYGLTNIDTAVHRWIEIRLRSSVAGPARIEFANGSGGRAVNRPSFEIAGDGGFHTYLLDFRGDAAWTHSAVTALALVLPETGGGGFSVDYLRIIETAFLPDGEAGVGIGEAVELAVPALASGSYALQSSASGGVWRTDEILDGAQTPTVRFRSLAAGSHRIAALGGPPQVSNPPAPVTVPAGGAFVHDLPAGTFTEPDGHAMRYAATLTNGLPLPEWLGIVADTGRLTGAPPYWAEAPLDLRILADDQVDGAATGTLALTVGPPTVAPSGPTAELRATQLPYSTVPDPSECWAFGDTNRLAEWAGTRADLKVLKLYIDTVNNATTQQLRNLAAVANAHGIRVAIELGGLLEAYCITGDTLNAGERSHATEIAKIRKWLDAGGTVDQLEFDDPINRAWYPENSEGVRVETGLFTLETATRELLDSMRLHRAAMPGVKFIYLPNFPNWGWEGGPAYYNFGFSPGRMGRGDFKPVIEHVLAAAARAGMPFHAICADHPRDYALGAHTSNQTSIKNTVDWMQRVRNLEAYAESRGVRFILIANDSTAGSTSGTAFQNAAADYVTRYRAAGGSPSGYNIQSWYDHPTACLPEAVEGTLARSILEAFGRF
ncbi:MAG: hypothetical protein FJ221_07405 [Lentisphaerae bacterium]|nr:hypothetical protein [Lentisphaerota bacterium]